MVSSFSFKMDNIEKIKRVLKLGESDKIIFLLTEDIAKIIFSSTYLYTQVNLPILVKQHKGEALVFVIDKEDFLNLAVTGVMKVTVTDREDVSLEFYDKDNKKECEYSTRFYIDDIGSSIDMIYKFSNYTEYSSMNVSSINSTMVRIARGLNLLVSFNKGNMLVDGPNIVVSSKYDGPYGFALEPKMLYNLMGFGDKFYRIENYIAYVDSDVCIAIKTLYPTEFDMDDYNFLRRRKTIFKSNVVINNMIGMLKKMKVKEGIVSIDFERDVCSFVNHKGTKRYVTEISAESDNEIIEDKIIDKDLESGSLEDGLLGDLDGLSEESNFEVYREKPSIIIPEPLVKGLLSYIRNDNRIGFEIKPNNIIMKTAGVTAVFARIKGVECK